MNNNIDLSKFALRTDLALEENDNDLEKIIEKNDDITVTSIKLNKNINNKKQGNYISIEFGDITDSNYQKKIEKIFIKYLKKLLNKNDIKKDDNCLIIGLGNEKSTPDSLGPLVIENVLVTNHLFMYGNVHEGFRKVSAISPGVMGQTGIETFDLIKSINNEFKYNFIIVIDSLASKSIKRLNRTIQISDTGISPGSGVGNRRKEISFETINTKVISIGVPTVVDAVTIVSDTIDFMYKNYFYYKDNDISRFTFGNINYLDKKMNIDSDIKKQVFGLIGDLDDEELRQLFFEVLTPIGYNLMVTPKEVDFEIEILSKIISNGINSSLHEKIN